MQYRCNTHAIPMHMTCNTYIHIHTHMHTRLTWQPLPRKAHPLHLSAPVRTHPDQPANRQKPARRPAKARFDSAKHVSLRQNTLFWGKTHSSGAKHTLLGQNTLIWDRTHSFAGQTALFWGKTHSFGAKHTLLGQNNLFSGGGRGGGGRHPQKKNKLSSINN